jgi:hypothetical protein
LHGIQQAYWVGRQGREGVACHSYFEHDARGLDIDRLERAWQALIERHDALRLVFDADGSQRVLREVPPYAFVREDLRGRAPALQEARIAALRAELSHQVLPAERWPLFEIHALRVSPAEGSDAPRHRLCVSVDLILVDGASMAMLLREWRELYATPERPLPPLPPFTFRDVALAEQARAGERSLAASRWRGGPRVAPPSTRRRACRSRDGGPRRGARASPDARRRLPASGWDRLRAEAARHGLTPSMVLCAAFAEVIEAWSSEPEFVLNLTTFRRAPIHPRVWDLAGDFTTMAFLDCRRAAGTSFVGFARALQAQLREQLDHRRVHGLDVVRAWSRSGAARIPGGVHEHGPRRRHRRSGTPGGSARRCTASARRRTSGSTTRSSRSTARWSTAGTRSRRWFPPGLLDDLFAAFGARVQDAARGARGLGRCAPRAAARGPARARRRPPIPRPARGRRTR